VSNCSAISWREEVTFRWVDDDRSYILDQHSLNYFYSATVQFFLKQQSVGRVRHVAQLRAIILISSQPWFYSFSLTLHCLAEKQQIPMPSSFTRPVLEPSIYLIHGNNTNHYTTDAVFFRKGCTRRIIHNAPFNVTITKCLVSKI
jgi:hypothetical protein